MLILCGWYGRLGNNFIQLKNMIDIAMYHKHNISFKIKHRYFDLDVIEKYFSKYHNKNVISSDSGFYSDRDKFLHNIEITDECISERNDLLKKSFMIKNVEKMNENTLVIHIRSGDIFNSRPHPLYVPPPLKYYIDNIIEQKPDKIIIVCEDKKNPVVDTLLTLYPNSIWKKNSLEDDIKIVLGSTNVISSVGTFIPSLLMISDNIKNHISYTNDNEYRKIMYPWKCSKIQKEYILRYGIQ